MKNLGQFYSFFSTTYITILFIIFGIYVLVTKYPFKHEFLFYGTLLSIFGFSVLLIMSIYTHFFYKKKE